MKEKTETATFAAGCFWHVQKKFDELPGVVSTRVGYTGGDFKNPNYEDVLTGKTEHVEAIEVIFNPKKIKYENLLDFFWKIHNPTTKNRQGFDIGRQYNSVIFYHDSKQRAEAEKSRKEVQKQTKNKIVTEILEAKEFWPAEEYHQKYIEKNKIKK